MKALYRCCHAVFKASATGLARNFPSKNRVDGVKEAGFSRANLTKKKDVYSSHICLGDRFVGEQVLFYFLHFLWSKKSHNLIEKVPSNYKCSPKILNKNHFVIGFRKRSLTFFKICLCWFGQGFLSFLTISTRFFCLG